MTDVCDWYAMIDMAIFGYIFPPDPQDQDIFWNDKKKTIKYSKYVNQKFELANADMSLFFDTLRDMLKTKHPMQLSTEELDDLLLMLRKINEYRCIRQYEFAHKWMVPYNTIFRGLRYRFAPYVRTLYDLYVVVCKYHMSDVSVYHRFGNSGTITLKLGEHEYSIIWKHDYYGVPIRQEEYVRIDGTLFCQKVSDIGHAADLMRFLQMYHMCKVVVSACVSASHAPKRLEYHMSQGGTIDTWEDIHFPNRV